MNPLTTKHLAGRPRLAVCDPGPVGLADAIDHQSEAARPGRTLPASIEPMLGINELAAIFYLLVLFGRADAFRAGKIPKPDLHLGRCPRWRCDDSDLDQKWWQAIDSAPRVRRWKLTNLNDPHSGGTLSDPDRDTY